MMNDFAFGNYLFLLRTRKGLSQKELARALRVSDKAVSKWENGRAKPKSATLLAAAALLGVSADELLSGGKRITASRDGGAALSPLSFSQSKLLPNSGRNNCMNLIPARSAENYDYLCTWSNQLRAARKLGLTGAGCANMRDALTDDRLFGAVNYYHPYDESYRIGLYLVLDDGWDVPFGSENSAKAPNVFGRCDPDPEKFPNYGATPVERLRTLNRKVQAMGYCGLGLWISPQMSGEDRAHPADLEQGRAYWRARARWCAEAGVRYWKIDWGVHCADAEYRRMMTEEARAAAPDLIIEHGVCQPPYTQLMSDPLDRVRKTQSILPLSDVFRLYDVAEPFRNSSMLMRLDEALSAAGSAPEWNTAGILNAETCAEISASMGCAIGLMRFAEDDLGAKACLRWHRLAPPFSVYEGEYRRSAETLTDSFYFDRNLVDWSGNVRGQKLEETAPAVMARNCALPQVEADGLRPFVCASCNPRTGAYAIAAIRRTVNPNIDVIAPARVTFEVGAPEIPVGVFGCFDQLTLVYTEPVSDRRVFAQDMLDDHAVDVTEQVRIDGSCVTLDGDSLRCFGRRSRSDSDTTEPSLVLALR